MELRYQQIEETLARFYRIRDQDRKAFRARIRHLRNIGIPRVPAVGKGSQVRYSADHLYELFFALELSQNAIGPAYVREYMERTALKSLPDWIKEVEAEPNGELLLGYSIRAFGGVAGELTVLGTYLQPPEKIWDMLVERLDAEGLRQVNILCFSSSVRRLQQILATVT